MSKSTVDPPEISQVNEPLPTYKNKEYYTYADYMAWEDDKQWELIDGVPYLMSAPTTEHQSILLELAVQFKLFLKGKKCKIFIAPCDVRLNADGKDDTVVQPDLFIVCDKNKLSDIRAIRGAPDIIVEILSPSSLKHDTLIKYQKYMEVGVGEYWVIDPMEKSVNVHLLENGNYTTRHYDAVAKVQVQTLPELTINLAEVFAV